MLVRARVGSAGATASCATHIPGDIEYSRSIGKKCDRNIRGTFDLPTSGRKIEDRDIPGETNHSHSIGKTSERISRCPDAGNPQHRRAATATHQNAYGCKQWGDEQTRPARRETRTKYNCDYRSTCSGAKSIPNARSGD
jgi:hypothetical protein